MKWKNEIRFQRENGKHPCDPSFLFGGHILQIVGHGSFGMFILKVLSIRFQIGHLRLFEGNGGESIRKTITKIKELTQEP